MCVCVNPQQTIKGPVLIMLMTQICHFIRKHFVPLDAFAQHICAGMYICVRAHAHVGHM